MARRSHFGAGVARAPPQASLAKDSNCEKSPRQVVVRGLAYLAWGLAFFALALLVSLLKGGLASRLRQAIADLNGSIDEPQSSGPP